MVIYSYIDNIVDWKWFQYYSMYFRKDKMLVISLSISTTPPHNKVLIVNKGLITLSWDIGKEKVN